MHQHKYIDLWTVFKPQKEPDMRASAWSVIEVYCGFLADQRNNHFNEMVYCEKYGAMHNINLQEGSQ